MTREGRLEPGARLKHLKIQREFGQGAFGQVLLARDVAASRALRASIDG